ncbi:MAG: hypothetical protein AVDCRST_MAG69-2001, partial [uncultured Solirubrobacteraceae bacterium]
DPARLDRLPDAPPSRLPGSRPRLRGPPGARARRRGAGRRGRSRAARHAPPGRRPRRPLRVAGRRPGDQRGPQRRRRGGARRARRPARRRRRGVARLAVGAAVGGGRLSRARRLRRSHPAPAGGKPAAHLRPRAGSHHPSRPRRRGRRRGLRVGRELRS